MFTGAGMVTELPEDLRAPNRAPDGIRLVNDSRVLLACLSPDAVVGLAVVDGGMDDVRGRYQIEYLRQALDLAQSLCPEGEVPSVRVMLSHPANEGSGYDRCLVLTIGDTKTAVVVAPRSDTWDNQKGERPALQQRYRYIGPASRVTPCEYCHKPDDVDPWCRDGDCPGCIDGECPFTGLPGEVRLRNFAKDLFEVVEGDRDE